MHAAQNIEIVTVHTEHRGAYAVAVYPTAKLGWAANYGALETYNHGTREDALASLKLSLSVCQPACGASNAANFARTLRAAQNGLEY